MNGELNAENANTAEKRREEIPVRIFMYPGGLWHAAAPAASAQTVWRHEIHEGSLILNRLVNSWKSLKSGSAPAAVPPRGVGKRRCIIALLDRFTQERKA